MTRFLRNRKTYTCEVCNEKKRDQRTAKAAS
jgi:hypothetical protein